MIRFNSITIIIFTLLILSSSAFAEDEQIFNNWSYPHYQDNLLIWEIKGKAAVVSADEIILSVLEITYYLQPVSPTTPAELAKKGKVLINAKTGTFKKQQQMVLLNQNITVRKISETADEFDETLMTDVLLINLADKTFSNDALITVKRNDISIKSKGCKGGLDFANISFAGNVETVIQGCNSKSISLGAVFSPKPNIDDEELNKTPSVITITSEGPMTIEKINGNPNNPPERPNGRAGKISQQIAFRNKVALVSYSQPPNLPARQANLRAENISILLDRRENPVTKRNNFYLASVSAANNVRMDDTFHNAACSALDIDEDAGLIILKGDSKSLAVVTRPLKPKNGTPQAKLDSYINISAQTMRIKTDENNLLLLGRKEITFSNGSIYNPETVLSSDSVSPTETALPVSQPPELFSQVKITADNDGLVSLKENNIYLENNVRILQKARPITDSSRPELRAEVKCDRLLITWDPAKNQLERLKSEGNVYILSDGAEAWGEILEWLPLSSQISIKSSRRVKLRHKNGASDENDGYLITINAGYMGSWSKMETIKRNENSNGGELKITHPPKEKEEPSGDQK
ncbi:MAG: LPS export ABC transporter periplasmic protein LptC [Planctomycetota bacterium]